MRRATRLPGSPSFVHGLINVRGVIVTVVDLGRRLDPTRIPTSQGSILLVRIQNRILGVAVDSVVDVCAIDEDPIPGVAVEGGVVRGIGRAGGADVLVLDLNVLIQQVLLS